MVNSRYLLGLLCVDVASAGQLAARAGVEAHRPAAQTWKAKRQPGDELMNLKKKVLIADALLASAVLSGLLSTPERMRCGRELLGERCEQNPIRCGSDLSGSVV